MSAAGYGHNSGEISPEAAAEIARLRTENTELKAQIVVLTHQRDTLQRRKEYNDVILSSQLPAPAKLIGVRVVNSADDEGRAIVRNKLLAEAASVKSLPHISRVVRSLKEAGIFQAVSPKHGPMVLQIPPTLDELQKAVEAYAAGLREQTPVCSTKQTARVEEVCSTEQTVCSPEQTYCPPEQSPGLLSRATGLPYKANSTADAKRNAPPCPPLSPHTPLSPPIIPPKEKERYTTVSVESGTARGLTDWAGDPERSEFYRSLGLSGDRFTVRHRDFSISIEAAAMANLAMPRAEVVGVVLGMAVQWATEIAGGKPAAKVVPQMVDRFVAAAVQRGHTRKQVGDAQIAQAGKSPQNVPNWHNRFDPRGSMRDS